MVMAHNVTDANGDVLVVVGPFEATPWGGAVQASENNWTKGALLGVLGAAEAASGKTPVASTFTATGASASFAPMSRRGFNVSLWGTFVGTVRLERSFDGGTTWLPLTAAGVALYVWTAPASEMAEDPETGVLYRLACTAYTSGTINYRVSQ